MSFRLILFPEIDLYLDILDYWQLQNLPSIQPLKLHIILFPVYEVMPTRLSGCCSKGVPTLTDASIPRTKRVRTTSSTAS